MTPIFIIRKADFTMDRRTFIKRSSLGIASLSAGGWSATEAPPAEMTHPLYLLTYDHGGLVLWGKEHFLERLRNAVEWLNRYPGFKIGLDNEAYTYDELARSAPKILDEMRGYLKKYAGRFAIGTCTYGQPLSVFINDESNIRQIEYAIQASRRYFDYTPAIYLMSEHAMHAQIPQILKGFGFQGAIMRTHYMMYGYNPTFDVPIGLWTGVDDSQIAAIPTYMGQGAEFGKTTVDNWILTRYPGGPDADKSLEDFRNEFSRIQPLLATRADDSGLRKEELVAMVEGKKEYQWILLEEILSNFPRPEIELKTLPNDFHVRMPWGYCGNEIWDECRRAEIAVHTAERLAAVEWILGGRDHQSALEEAWKNLLTAQHHDIQICGLLEEARRFLPTSYKASEQIGKDSLTFAASRMEGGETAQLTVFNPLSWARTDWVEIPIELPRGAAKAIQIRRGNQQIPYTVLSSDLHSDGSIRSARLALEADLKALEIASYAIVPATETPPPKEETIYIEKETLFIETPLIRLRFHPQGGIASLTDRKSNRDILKPESRQGFFAGKIDGDDCESRGSWVIERAKGGAPWAVARESGLIGGIPYQFEMIVRSDIPRLDCEVSFSFDGQRIGRLSDDQRDSRSAFIHEDKLRFKIFPDVHNQAIGIRDLPFAVSETNDRYVQGIYWTALSDEAGGCAFFNRGAMGAVRESDGGFSLPLAYAMYYIWGTRMLNGRFTYRFSLYPFSGRWATADLHRRALEYSHPCVGLCTPPGDGRLGNESQILQPSSRNVILSALYPRNGSLYARFYEYRGEKGALELSTNQHQAKIDEVNLIGKEIRPLSLPAQFEPWEIRTFRICGVPGVSG